MLDYKTVKELAPHNCYSTLVLSMARGVVDGRPSLGDPTKTFGEQAVDLLREELVLLETGRALTGKPLPVLIDFYTKKCEELPGDQGDMVLFKIKAAAYVLESRDEVVS